MEPVSLAEAKAHLEVDDDHRDALIEGYITAAREMVESFTGRILVRREVTEHRSAFDRFFELRRRPVVHGTATIAYSDASHVETPVALTSVRSADTVRLFPAAARWPALDRNGEITIVYTAGYAPGEVPQALIQAILLLVGEFYENREASSGSLLSGPVASLLRPYRTFAL